MQSKRAFAITVVWKCRLRWGWSGAHDRRYKEEYVVAGLVDGVKAPVVETSAPTFTLN